MENIIQKLNKNKLSMDILIAIDEFFENTYLYVYPNFMNSIIEAGPHLYRHWIGLVLKTYDYPNKHVLETFENVGIKFYIKQFREKLFYSDIPPDPTNPVLIDRAYYSYPNMEHLPQQKLNRFYRIYLLIPKRLIKYDWNLPYAEKYEFDSQQEKEVKDNEKNFSV